MPFAFQWTDSLGPATTNRDTPIEAIRFAIDMLAKRFRDLLIIDLNQDGKAHSRPSFRHSTKPRRSSGQSEDAPMPSDEEIRASRLVLTDDRIADLQMPEFVIKLMLEAAEQVRTARAKAHASAAD
jgi:hypothetical protein